MKETVQNISWNKIFSAQAGLPIFRGNGRVLGLGDDHFTEIAVDEDRERLAVNARQNNPYEVAFLCLAYTVLGSWWLAELLAGWDRPGRALLLWPLVLLLFPWVLQAFLCLCVYAPWKMLQKVVGWRQIPDNTLMTHAALYLLTLAALVRVMFLGVGRWPAWGWLGFLVLNALIWLWQQAGTALRRRRGER